MLPEQLLAQIQRLGEAYAKAETCRALSNVTTDQAESAHLRARAEYWQTQLSQQYDALTVAINSMIPPTVYADPDPSSPVWLANERDLEVRGAINTGGRRVSIRFSPEQAIAVGTILIACAAVNVDRLGSEFGTILPPVPPTVTVDAVA